MSRDELTWQSSALPLNGIYYLLVNSITWAMLVGAETKPNISTCHDVAMWQNSLHNILVGGWPLTSMLNSLKGNIEWNENSNNMASLLDVPFSCVTSYWVACVVACCQSCRWNITWKHLINLPSNPHKINPSDSTLKVLRISTVDLVHDVRHVLPVYCSTVHCFLCGS